MCVFLKLLRQFVSQFFKAVEAVVSIFLSCEAESLDGFNDYAIKCLAMLETMLVVIQVQLTFSVRVDGEHYQMLF